jgi:hypothetical protein
MCSKIDASQQDKKFLLEQIFELGLVPRWEQKWEVARLPDQTTAPNLTPKYLTPKCPSRGRNTGRAGRFVGAY